MENPEVSEDQSQQNPVDQTDVDDERLPISSEIERELTAQEKRQDEAAPWGEMNETLTVLSEENLKKESYGKEDLKKEEQSAMQENSTQNTLGQVDTVARLMAGIRTAISGNGTASGLLSSAIRTVQNVAMENNFGNDIPNEMDAEISQSGTPKSESQKPERNVLEEKLKERWKETKKNTLQEGENSKNTQKNDDKNQKNDDKKREKKPAETEPFPELENSDFLRELDRLERENNGADHLWKQLQHRYVRVLAFDYEKGCEILSIRPQDIGLLPREIWHYGNNSFLLHGYYNYRHLILARMNNPQGPYRYLLGVPGHYFSNEKYLASMFGFPHFVLARKQPDQDGRFGYWYTEIRL